MTVLVYYTLKFDVDAGDLQLDFGTISPAFLSASVYADDICARYCINNREGGEQIHGGAFTFCDRLLEGG